MDKKSVKKYIYWGLFIIFVVGSIMTGSPFNFIDMIVVRPIVVRFGSALMQVDRLVASLFFAMK